MASTTENDILVQDVAAWAEFPEIDLTMRLTDAEINRRTGQTVGKATVKGFVDNYENIPEFPGEKIVVRVVTSSNSQTDIDPFEDSIDQDVVAFTGQVMKATQNEKGLYVFEAYDAIRLLQNQRVQLNVENPSFTYRVLRNVLDDAFPGGVTSNLSEAGLFTPYMEPKSEFTYDTKRVWQFGNAERGEDLISVVKKLSRSLGAFVWSDRKGRLRVEQFPSYIEWQLPYITKIGSGEDSDDSERVIFEASGVSSEGGLAAAYVKNQSGINIEADIAGAIDKDTQPPDRVLKDNNVKTQLEAENVAFNEAVNRQQKKDMGTVTIVGNPGIDIFDEVTVVETDYDFTNIARPVPNALQQGTFNVDEVTHKISGKNGYTTKLKLTESFADTFPQCSLDTRGGGEGGFFQQYLNFYNNKKSGEGISGTGTGEFVDLFT